MAYPAIFKQNHTQQPVGKETVFRKSFGKKSWWKSITYWKYFRYKNRSYVWTLHSSDKI